jgi:hypothetical protein
VLGEADVAHAVIEDDRIAEPVAEPLRDFGAEHGVEQLGKWLARCQGQRLRVGVAEVLEVGGGGAKDGKAVMGIAQRQRDRPGDGGILGDRAVALPTDVVGRFAEAEDGVEHQLHRAAAGADDEVGPRHRLRETVAGFQANTLDGEQQGDAEGDGDQRHAESQSPVPGAASRQQEQ